MNTLDRIKIFFELWGSYHYENRIDAQLAWELAGIFVYHSIEWDGMIVLKDEVEKMNACYHATGTVLFSFWRLSITRCDWGCNEIHFEWKHRDGVTRTFWTVQP